MSSTTIIALACTTIFCSSCTSRKQTGALYGAGAGAAIGAAVDEDNRGRGAAIGAGVGAVLGAVIAESYDSGTTPPQQGQPRFPMAKPTDKQGFVWSPYPPHQPIDIRGFRSGEVAVDPTTEKPFIIP